MRAARKELARIERSLAKLSRDSERLHAELAEHATDHVQVSSLDAQLRMVQAQVRELEERWLSVAEDAS